MFGWFGGLSVEDMERVMEAQKPKKIVPPKPNPELKVEELFTLSVYSCGKHRTRGEIKPIDIEDERLTFEESLLPFKAMIQQFKDCRLGSKIKVTLEVID